MMFLNIYAKYGTTDWNSPYVPYTHAIASAHAINPRTMARSTPTRGAHRGRATRARVSGTSSVTASTSAGAMRSAARRDCLARVSMADLLGRGGGYSTKKTCPRAGFPKAGGRRRDYRLAFSMAAFMSAVASSTDLPAVSAA